MALPNVTLLTTCCQQGKLLENEIQGNRSIVFNVADRLPEEALRHCISLALTYHLRKKQRASQK
jgi:hypothetical protein